MFYVTVRFFDQYNRDQLKGGEYTYKSHRPVKIGDVLVVDTSRGFALAQCVGYPKSIPDWPETTWRSVVDIVDMDEWELFEAERFRAFEALI